MSKEVDFLFEAIREANLLYFNDEYLLEMSHNNKKVMILVIYRSPSQNNDEIHSFLANSENLIIF